MGAASIIKQFQKNNVFRNTQETVKPINATFQGKIPDWLNGTLYRIGPAKYQLEGKGGRQIVIEHAFDGLPFVHRFELSSEKQTLTYNSRNIAEGVEKALVNDKQKEVSMIWFGHVAQTNFLSHIRGIFGRMTRSPGSKFPEEADPSALMVGVTVTPNYPLPSKWKKQQGEQVLVTKTDANLLQQVNSKTLEPKRLFTYAEYDDHLNGQLSAAHHQHDPRTGEIINFTLKFGPMSGFQVFSVDPQGKTTILANVTHRLLPDNTKQPVRLSYLHSFWMTENYVIIPESPLHYVKNGIDVILTGSIAASLGWEENTPTYLHVISRRPGVGHVITLPVDPFFTFHVSNGWDTTDSQGNTVLNLDCCAFPNGDILYEVSRFGQPRRATEYNKENKTAKVKVRGMTSPPDVVTLGDLRRYRLEWNEQKKGKATYKTLATNVEFPRIVHELTLKPNRYVWGCRMQTVSREQPDYFVLVKVDTETGNVITMDQPGLSCSEPIFVPRPGGTEEDDGALVAFVNALNPVDPNQDRCLLLVVDAKNMKEIARADIGPFTATTFHGSFVDQYFKNVTVN